jgi:hypothetical protein
MDGMIFRIKITKDEKKHLLTTPVALLGDGIVFINKQRIFYVKKTLC